MPYKLDNNYSLLIGVGECIDSRWSLPVTVKDVQKLKSVLTNPDLCGYIDDEEHMRLLCNETAIGSNILEGLKWLKQTIKKPSEATVIIYYSGHGYRDEINNKYYLVPHDSINLISAEEFTQAILEIKAKQLLVVVDSCHAEGMAKSTTNKSNLTPTSWFLRT